MEIDTMLRAVAEARRLTVGLKERKRQLEDDWRAEHMDFLQQVEAAQKNLAVLESGLRETAVQDWLDAFQRDASVSKMLMPGITIREAWVAVFDLTFAIKWAEEHRMALKLDEAAYRKLVLLGQAPGQRHIEYTAAIAKDLDAVLANG